MTKTLAIILNHNLPDNTSWLYSGLKKFEIEEYEMEVMDNGSRPDFIPHVLWSGCQRTSSWAH